MALLMQMSTWWFLTWTGPEIKEKVVSLPGVEHLYDVMSPNEISVPSFVMEYDKKVSKEGRKAGGDECGDSTQLTQR